MIFHKKKVLPYHTNGMKFTAFSHDDSKLFSMNYYSIGGGFFLSEDDIKIKAPKSESVENPWEFNSGKEAIKLCE